MMPADWTDYTETPSRAGKDGVGSVEDLLRIRCVVDALQRRLADSCQTANLTAESAGANQTEFHRGQCAITKDVERTPRG
jgi:hypothetical protein